ncbi:MAG: hypothetical protein ABI690_09910 [Chloroflexota bacterium]
MDRSVRSLISIILVVAAVFVAMDRVAQSAPLGDWWLAVALILVALLLYVWDWNAARADTADDEPLVEPGQSSLDGFRQVAASVTARTASIAPAADAPSQAELDHQEIVQAYSEIRDTDVRSDGMASASTTDTQEARSVKDMVENIMDVGAMGTFEEVDEIAGGPVDSRSQDHPRTSPPKAKPLVTTPAPAKAEASVPTPPPAPKPVQAPAKDSSADGSEAVTGTQARSDEMASAATMDSAEAKEAETGIVENIMDTGASGKPEEVDEIAGGPAPSHSEDQLPTPPPAPKKAKAKSAAPKAKAETTKPDDLTVIEGIGPKMASALVAGGLESFAKLSQATEVQINAAIEAAGMRFAPSVPTWAEQAALAAKGDWDALKAFQDTLKGGRKK